MILLYISCTLAVLFYLLFPLMTILSEKKKQKKLYDDLNRIAEGERVVFRGYRYSQPEGKTMWLQAEGRSALINLQNSRFFRMEEDEKNHSFNIRCMGYKDFIDLSEGMAIDAIGKASTQGGILSILSSIDAPSNIILNDYEGNKWEENLKKALQRGYLFFSPWLSRSILAGAISSILFLSLAITRGNPPGFVIVNLILALTPLFPLIPPGGIFFLISLSLWKRKGQILALITFLTMIVSNTLMLFYLLVWLFAN